MAPNLEQNVFESFGFELIKDNEGKPFLGENGEPRYEKSFVRHHKWYSFYTIIASQNPTNSMYELKLDRIKHPYNEEVSDIIKQSLDGTFELTSHLEKVAHKVKEIAEIGDEVELSLDVELYAVKNLRVKHSDFERAYRSFDKMLMMLKYLDKSTINEKSIDRRVRTAC